MRRLSWIGVLVLALGMAIPAMAQDNYSRVEAYVGYDYIHLTLNGGAAGSFGFNFNGASGQVAFNMNHWLGAVADIGGYTTGSNGLNTNVISYLFGPRISRHGEKLTPFAQILLGGARIANGFAFVTPENEFAMTVGGGLDYKVSPRFAVRPVQAEYMLTRFNDLNNHRQNNFRYSAGIVFLF